MPLEQPKIPQTTHAPLALVTGAGVNDCEAIDDVVLAIASDVASAATTSFFVVMINPHNALIS